MADQKIRSFLAIRPDEPLIQEAYQFISKRQSRYSQFKLIPPQNWHSTLHFFGSLTIQEVESVIKSLPKMISEIRPFSISLKGLGAFPEEKKARILWIGFAGELSHLIRLKKTLDQSLIQMRFPVETRTYHPHITIGRAQKPINCSISGSEKKFEFKTLSQIERITLFRSDLTSTGSHYTVLADFPLNRT